MYERFSDQARLTIADALEQARRLGHSYIGTEHLLLGLLAQDRGTASRTLELLVIDPEAVREQALALAGTGAGSAATFPFTRQSRKVLEYTLGEALKGGHRFIGAEHILLAMMRERDGIAGQVLRGLGADLEAARGFVAGLVESAGLPPGVTIERRPPRRAGWRRGKPQAHDAVPQDGLG